MSLTDVTYDENYEMDPEDLKNCIWIQLLRQRLRPNSFKRLVKTTDEAIETTISPDGKLTWTKTGVLFGYSSLQPKKHIDLAWDRVKQAVGDGKECLLTMGSLVRWRIAVREEPWLLYCRETDSFDPDTGKKIHISEYWIDRS